LHGGGGGVKGEDIVTAVDLASTLDFTATATVQKVGEIINISMKFYIPEGRLERRTHWQQIRLWAADGWITLTPGNATDYNYVKEDIRKLAKDHNMQEVSFDPWNSTHFASELVEEGLEVVEFRQGYKSLSPAAKEFERLIVDKKINHGGNPVLEWMMSNTVITKDPANNIKPDKSKSDEKIDGIIAALMACHRLGVYEEGEIERGFIEL